MTIADAKRDVYVRIMLAAYEDRGLRLTADDAFDLRMDDAISTRAAVVLEEHGLYFDNGKIVKQTKG